MHLICLEHNQQQDEDNGEILLSDGHLHAVCCMIEKIHVRMFHHILLSLQCDHPLTGC